MRVRLRYTEHGPIRFLGHRDLARCWERAIRRDGLPIAYSEGFSPRPKLHFGLALSVGHESDAEFIDVDLRAPVALEGLAERLSELLPVGVEVVSAAEVDRGATALQAAVEVVVWHLRLAADEDLDRVRRSIDDLLAREVVEVRIERKGETQTADLRPAVRGLRVEAAPDGPIVVAELATRPRAFRPNELIAALEPPLTVRLVVRHEQLMTDDGRLVPLLEAPGRPDPAAERLAS